MAIFSFYALLIGAMGMCLITLIVNAELENYMNKCERQQELIEKLMIENKRA